MTDDELSELLERDSQIQEMAGHPGWQVLRDFILERAEPIQRGLLNGSPKTIEEYRAESGWFRGVRDVLEAPETHSRRVEMARAEHGK